MTDIEFRADTSFYTQIADHFRRQVALARLKPGDRLPTIRDLAEKLGIDPGTVARAYRELEREAIITSRRGDGTFVSANAGETRLMDEQRRRLGGLLERGILEAMGLGFTADEIETAFTLRLAEWRERRAHTAAAVKASRPAGELRFFGSHDLAIELLASHLNLLHPDLRLAKSFVGSLAGLMALETREADIAGAHLLDSESGEYNVPFIRRLMPHETVVLLNLAQRVQGLMLAPGNLKRITGIGDLTRDDVTFVNRQKGSGTRMLLDAELLKLDIAPQQIKGYQREENTHVAVATLVAEGHADVGLGAQSAASAVGLDFIPLLKERYDLIAFRDTWEQARMKKLKQVVVSQGFQKMLTAIPGYDLSESGRMITVGPKIK